MISFVIIIINNVIDICLHSTDIWPTNKLFYKLKNVTHIIITMIQQFTKL